VRHAAFLDRELERGPKNCWIACHCPLFRSVMGDSRRHFTSAMSAFYAKPDDRIRALLSEHPNARLWLSGHTHSPLSARGPIKRVPLAPKRSIVAINGSGLSGSASAATRAPALLALPYPAGGTDRVALPRPPRRRLAPAPGPRGGGNTRAECVPAAASCTAS
jgi:hypothetical protein